MSLSNSDKSTREERAWLSLEGLSLGDAFGQCFFAPELCDENPPRTLPRGPWFYTDDTMMAWSIVDVLRECGRIDQDRLAQAFASRFQQQRHRGYGRGAAQLLEHIGQGGDWRQAAPQLFDGKGSLGNGGAMRVAPLGAYFGDDLDRVVAEAEASAAITHAHPEGKSGAIAIAVAAARVCQWKWGPTDKLDLIAHAHSLTPDGQTRDKIAEARELGPETSAFDAAVALGSGQQIRASDTVPYALWCAERFINDYADAMWQTVSGFGDRDTTCAMVGGIVALSVGREGLPHDWLRRREPLEE